MFTPMEAYQLLLYFTCFSKIFNKMVTFYTFLTTTPIYPAYTVT